MLTQQTVEKLHTLRLRGMAEAFREQEQDPEIHRLSFEERLGLLVDRQWNWKHNQALERRLINARLRGNACIENINYRASRGLDRQRMRSLTLESAWVREHQNIFLVGATGVGKTYLARALGQKACRDGYKALFIKATQLFRDLAMARADGSVSDLLYRLGRVNVLIVDDFAMTPLSEGDRRDFLDICDERYQASNGPARSPCLFTASRSFFLMITCNLVSYRLNSQNANWSRASSQCANVEIQNDNRTPGL
jgi:DNA replication protein DnaC